MYFFIYPPNNPSPSPLAPDDLRDNVLPKIKDVPFFPKSRACTFHRPLFFIKDVPFFPKIKDVPFFPSL
ncbi:MAG: hypothetical protein COS41_01635 [Elusimicrobia bacterium CG03_land_8_20_14_0_80_50_18]|nr:MAG: hypothetical protein COS41_01635 [Elusimicrobia bacterium CG03_land_8_20_14_0_80_50_18]